MMDLFGMPGYFINDLPSPGAIEQQVTDLMATDYTEKFKAIKDGYLEDYREVINIQGVSDLLPLFLR